MGAAPRRAVRLIWAAVYLAAIIVVPAVLTSPVTPPDVVIHTATCPPGMVANPGGYGCVPDLAPGGAAVGAPSQEVLTRCKGNYYICIWPYPVP